MIGKQTSVMNGKTYTLECYKNEIAFLPDEKDLFYCITDENGDVVAHDRDRQTCINKALVYNPNAPEVEVKREPLILRDALVILEKINGWTVRVSLDDDEDEVKA